MARYGYHLPCDWPTWSPSEALIGQAGSAEDSLSPPLDYNTTSLIPTDGIHDPSAYTSYTKLLD